MSIIQHILAVLQWRGIAYDSDCFLLFTECRNARIANAVLATAVPSVCPSICPSVTGRYCVKMTARNMVQFALSDSKMCLVLYKPRNILQERPLPPEILVQTDVPLPDSRESWHVLPCIASTVRASEKSSIITNRKGSCTRAFQQAINQGSMPPLTSSKLGSDKVTKFVVFWTISTIKDKKSAAKFH